MIRGRGKELAMTRTLALVFAIILGTSTEARAEPEFVISFWFGPAQ
jgi:hypothetical protein